MESQQPSASVHDLLMIFRDALIALVPSMNRAMIPWREGESYDDWDLITEALYRSIVVGSCEDLLEHSRPIARYGFMIPDYLAHSFIAVSLPRNGPTPAAFVRFATLEVPFDMVRVRTLAPAGYTVTSTLDVPADGVSFSLFANRDGRFTKAEHVPKLV